MNAFARIFSVLFHPLLMATYLFSLLAWALPSALTPLKPESHLTFIILIFIVTFILPLTNMGIFKAFGTIHSFEMKERKERTLPFIFITLIYIVVTFLFYYKVKISLSDNFLKLMIIIDLLVLASTIATFFFKVSVHSVGIWGLVGITMLLTKISEVPTLFYAAVVLIVLAGFIMSSRLWLQAHSFREVMWGAVLGLATSITGMLILF